MKYLILLFSILLIGCSKSIQIECENITINNTVEIIKYVDKIIEVNKTCQECKYIGSTNRELELIRRIQYLESNQDKYFNDSECNDNLNRTENKLIDCEEEVCWWNSSWC